MGDLRSSRGCDRVKILSTFKILVRDLPGNRSLILLLITTFLPIPSYIQAIKFY